MRAIVVEAAKYYFLCRMDDGREFYLDRNALPYELRNVVQVGDELTIDRKVEKAS